MKQIFANNVKYLRTLNRMNQKQLANKLNINSSAISGYERGRNLPKLETLLKMKDLFNISIDDLLTIEIKQRFQIDPKTGKYDELF